MSNDTMINVTTSISGFPFNDLAIWLQVVLWLPRYNGSLLTMTMRLTLFSEKLFTAHGYLKLCWSPQINNSASWQFRLLVNKSLILIHSLFIRKLTWTPEMMHLQIWQRKIITQYNAPPWSWNKSTRKRWLNKWLCLQEVCNRNYRVHETEFVPNHPKKQMNWCIVFVPAFLWKFNSAL